MAVAAAAAAAAAVDVDVVVVVAADVAAAPVKEGCYAEHVGCTG